MSIYNWLLSWLWNFYPNLHILKCNEMFSQKIIILMLPLCSTETPTKKYFIQETLKPFNPTFIYIQNYKFISSKTDSRKFDFCRFSWRFGSLRNGRYFKHLLWFFYIILFIYYFLFCVCLKKSLSLHSVLWPYCLCVSLSP